MNGFRHWVTGVLPTGEDLRRLAHQPRQNLMAGLVVAIVALPLALGFGVSSGMGAAAGLTTAIVAGVLAAAFGGSHLQVSGPTGAMTVVLVPIMQQHGASGVLTVGLLAGVVLVALGLARAGRFVRYVPLPVVEGFTVGIAAVIFLQQIPAALGVSTPHGDRVLTVAWQAVQDYLRHPQLTAVLVAAGVALAILVGQRFWPRVPFSLVAVGAATLIAVLAGLDLTRIGHLPAALPAPTLSFLDITAVPTLTTAALAVAALAALESLLSASIADQSVAAARSPQSSSEGAVRHDPDRELFGQGVANLVAPLFGGVPATAAIARTAVNVRAGATSKLAAITHAIILALVMLLAEPLVMHIPLAALAGVLLATSLRMVQLGSLLVLARSNRADALIMLLTAACTLAFDLIVAVGVGLLVAMVLAMTKLARSARLEEVPLDLDPASPADADELRRSVRAYRLDGPLFFVAHDRFLDELSRVDGVRVVILRMSRLWHLDSTGATELRHTMEQLERRGISVLISGVQPAHEPTMAAVGLLNGERAEGKVFGDAGEAVKAAQRLILAGGD